MKKNKDLIVCAIGFMIGGGLSTIYGAIKTTKLKKKIAQADKELEHLTKEAKALEDALEVTVKLSDKVYEYVCGDLRAIKDDEDLKEYLEE